MSLKVMGGGNTQHELTVNDNGKLCLDGIVVDYTPVGTIIAQYSKKNPIGYLYLDGRNTTGTDDELSTKHPELYAYLGNTNILPDYREFALVGAEQNTHFSTSAHDVFTAGQEKDYTFSQHAHNVYVRDTGHTHSYTAPNGTTSQFNGPGYEFYPWIIASKTGVDYAQIQVNASPNFDGLANATTSVGTPGATRGKRKAVYWYIKY